MTRPRDAQAPVSTLYWSPESATCQEGHGDDTNASLVSIDPPPSTQETIDATQSAPSLPLDREAFALVPGRRLPESRIEVGQQIGVGATAIVYRGLHVDLERPLAVKVLKRGVTWADARDRFLAEARVTSELDSAYVVDVVDFGTLPDGRMWSAMELLDGQPLADEIDKGPMSAERTISLLRMACKGLHAAHSKGVVHRDIKPDNLMLIQREGRERLVLVDFGIATTDTENNDERCGTPRYMAPEQILGEPLDGRTDLYALGCCAYEMLTGKLLVRSSSVDDVLETHINGVRPEFDDSDEVPPGLRSVIERCLKMDPEDRYGSAAELEAALCEAGLDEDLECVTDVLPLPDVPDPQIRRRLARAMADASAPRGRRWRVGVAAAALACFGTIGAGFSSRHADTLDTSTTLTAQHVATAAAGSLATIQDAAVQSAAVSESPPRLLATRSEVPPPPPPSFKLSAKPASAVVARGSGSTREPERPGSAEETTWSQRRRARVEVRRGKRAARVGSLANAREHFEKALALDSRRADAHAGLADLDFDAGHHRSSLRHARLAVRLSPRNADHRVRLGDAYLRVSQRNKARAQYQRAESLGSRVAARRLEAL